ncbi:MAG: YkgJ family cysteine cluster protein [Limnobacter sp.]|nr:YkgJ family cysteine cluster protein [Limnobacter sp.]
MPNSTDQDPNLQDPARLNQLRQSVEQSVGNIKVKALHALTQGQAPRAGEEGAGGAPSHYPVQWIQELHSQVDLLAQTAQLSTGAFACKEGCTSCCHARVEVTPPEVFAIANYLAAEQEDRRPVFISRLVSRSAAPAPESHWSTRPACALLVDNRCSVYPVRPAACRKGHSYDAQACKADQAELPLHYGFVLGAEVWMAGVAQGYEAAGFQSPILELCDALLKVLQNPQMQSDWLEGRSVF